MPIALELLQVEDFAAAVTPCAVVGVFEDLTLDTAAAAIDKASDGALSGLTSAGDASGKAGTCHCLHRPSGIGAERVLLIGLGKRDKFDDKALDRAARTAAAALATMPVESALHHLAAIEVAGRDASWRVRTVALATDHLLYRYGLHGKGNGASEPKLKTLQLAAGKDAEQGLRQARGMIEGITLARDLGNTPPNICTPAYLAERARQMAAKHDGVAVEVLEPEALREAGMGALLAVGEGSVNTPRLIVLRWNGGGDSAPYALVGKGVTFDSGGINIKPSAGMEEMKFDMCGAAGVLGAFQAAVALEIPLNLMCVVPAAENMPGGKSYRPSDVLTTASGITVEVLNTDAEGRLILCDALDYVQKQKPAAIIDVATLTGACVIALGPHATGLMSKHDTLAEELLGAGNHTLDRAWRLPLWDDYQSMLESATADVANLGGKSAGAITAGCFLSRFVGDSPWAHLDIAGTAWTDGRKGRATGRPVPLLVQWLLERAG